jgi:hypothetical protein
VAAEEKNVVNDGLQAAERWIAGVPRSQPRHILAVAILTALMSMALCIAAILAPAPAAVAPVVVAICIGSPLFAGWEVPFALAALRADRAGGKLLARFQRTLEELPETEHPLGL